MPICMAYQAHGLITDGLEMIAEDNSVEDSTLLMYIAMSAAFGFFFSSTFPPLTDVKNEKRRRLLGGECSTPADHHHPTSTTTMATTEERHAAEDHHVAAAVHHDDSSSCNMLTYRSKMLSPSHKEMWAIWVGLLCEIFVNCIVSQTAVDKALGTYSTAGIAVFLFVIVGYFFGQDFAEEFEHHVEHQMNEILQQSNNNSNTFFNGVQEEHENEVPSDMYVALS